MWAFLFLSKKEFYTLNFKLWFSNLYIQTKRSCKLCVDAGGEVWRHWKNLLEIRFAKETTCLLFSMSDFPQFIITFICCVKQQRTVTWIKYLGAEEKHSIVCDFGDKMYGKIKTSISVWGIVGAYWSSYQVLRIICIDYSLSQIYFTSSLNSSNQKHITLF